MIKMLLLRIVALFLISDDSNKVMELLLGMRVPCCREANLGTASKVEKCGK
jgi:hypothetical protein